MAPTSTTSSPDAVSGAPSAAAPALVACTGGQLTLSRTEFNAGIEQTWWIYFLVNNGSACALQGWPWFDIRTSGGASLAREVREPGVPIRRVLIQTKSFASFYADEICGPQGAVQPPISATVLVQFPGQPSPATLHVPQMQDCVQDVAVSAVEPGLVQPAGFPPVAGTVRTPPP